MTTPRTKEMPRWLCAVLALPALFVGFDARPASACATAPPRGEPVAVAAESAIIVWDEASKTEHFIRRASFKSAAKDFGFLVPSPTKPELTEGSDGTFATLEDVIRPDVTYVDETKGIDCTPFFFAIFARAKKSAAVASQDVRILEQKRIAGYDAVVLEADDPGALAEWLKSHGYDDRPALTEWLTPYVAQKWKLTAFKIADPDHAADAGIVMTMGTTPVHMTFKTERPFFPYREPRDQRESLPPTVSTSRSLRVFFIGNTKVAATIGDGKTTFLGKTVHAKPLESWQLGLLPVKMPEGSWLTTFEDDASPRPGVDELWFDRAKDATFVRPPDSIVTRPRPMWIPADAVLLSGLVIVLIARGLRNPRRASPPR